MTFDDIESRFKATMIEIAEKIKLNSLEINIKQIIEFINVILEIYRSKRKVFVYGAGRSGFIGRCFAQRLMHLGINSCFVSDTITHRYTKEDLLILVSGSGETLTSKAVANKAKNIGGKIILLTGNPNSSIGKISSLVIKIIGKDKSIAFIQETLAPYTSLFDISALSVLDSIGGALMKALNVSEKDIDMRHASLE
ncbi:MAG: SIS domain-containing protein [Candidatus Hermodarchaeota archaeon]